VVTFRCKRSGNCVSFSNENDIAGLRKHEGYIEVKENGHEEVKEIKSPDETGKEVLKREVLKLKGRPKKEK
jgi:hypothetical protein